MKRTLYGTTALVAAGLMASGAAVAQSKPTPVQLSVGGYFQGEFVYSNDDLDNIRDHGIQREAEIIFRGQTRLDNGLLIGVRVELEAEVCADQIDESWIFFDSDSWGRVEFGSTDQVGWKMYYGSPDAIPGHSKSVYNIFDINLPAGSLLTGAPIARLDLANDSEHINYFTPRIAGFQLGVSYTPDNCEENNAGIKSCGGSFGGMEAENTSGQQSEAKEVAVNYVNKFGGFDVAVYGAYAEAELELATATVIDDQKQYGAGFQLGFAGFTVGGAYRVDETGNINGDVTDWNVGVRYVTGPWGIGADYGWKEAERAAADEDELQVLSVGVTYLLGPGITLVGGVEFFEAESDVVADNDGTIFIVGTNIVF